jgi:hypothetical protein
MSSGEKIAAGVYLLGFGAVLVWVVARAHKLARLHRTLDELEQAPISPSHERPEASPEAARLPATESPPTREAEQQPQ